MRKFYLFFAFLWLGFIGASAQKYHYDVNTDGDVNITDAVMVVNKILGKLNPGEVEGLEEVDLGLPSGTIWANINVGATKPEEVGGYYAWGETTTKDNYSQDTYQYYQNGSYVDLGADISGTQYDVATALWGEDWCMPTKQQALELINNCTHEWTTVNGVVGCRFISKTNGNSIFIPCGGYKRGINTYESYAYIMTSTGDVNALVASYYSLGINNSYIGCDIGPLYDGTPVRPVRTPLHKAIDLGLPSGTKWASCNVGANKPEEYGEYFAWGELEEKEEYTEDSYLYYDSENWEYMSLPNNISGTKYDVARKRWGGNWRMPTYEEVRELKEKCSFQWVSNNGVGGAKITGPNGNSIFLPASGYRDGVSYWDEWDYYDNCYGSGAGVLCWSGTIHDSNEGVWILNYAAPNWENLFYNYEICTLGLSVRPVCK